MPNPAFCQQVFLPFSITASSFGAFTIFTVHSLNNMPTSRGDWGGFWRGGGQGGAPGWLPAYPAFSLFVCPLSPRPPSPAGKGETITLFRRGLRPRHPGIKPPAALTEPAAVVPGGGLSLCVACSAGVNGAHGWRGGWDAALANSAGSQGEGGPGEMELSVADATAAFEMVLSPGAGRASAAGWLAFFVACLPCL